MKQLWDGSASLLNSTVGISVHWHSEHFVDKLLQGRLCHCPASLCEVIHLAEDHVAVYMGAGKPHSFLLFSPPSPCPCTPEIEANSHKTSGLDPGFPYPSLFSLSFTSTVSPNSDSPHTDRNTRTEGKPGQVRQHGREARHFQDQDSLMEAGTLIRIPDALQASPNPVET